eukprot:scaffold67793_cov48-Phaeocystis_antarctica.AAC.1
MWPARQNHARNGRPATLTLTLTLTRPPMQPMLDATNAAAEAKGEAVPSDFFGSLDKDKARS